MSSTRQTAKELSAKERWRSLYVLQNLWERLYRDKFALISLVFLIAVLLSSIFCAYLAPYDPSVQNLRGRLLPPGTEGHILGTDSLGRDLFSRLLYGGRLSLFIGFIGVMGAMAIGVTLGVISGYFRGKTDTIIMRVVDIQMAFSSLLMIMLLVVMIGPGVSTLLIVFSLVTWVVHARIVRGAVLHLREVQFVQAARSIGATDAHIILHHILPNIVSIMTSIGILEAARIMVGEASLSFLGFGVQPPNISWGLLIAEGRDYLTQAWWLSTFPGLAITFTILAVNMVGIWLRAISDPFQRSLMGKTG